MVFPSLNNGFPTSAANFGFPTSTGVNADIFNTRTGLVGNPQTVTSGFGGVFPNTGGLSTDAFQTPLQNALGMGSANPGGSQPGVSQNFAFGANPFGGTFNSDVFSASAALGLPGTPGTSPSPFGGGFGGNALAGGTLNSDIFQNFSGFGGFGANPFGGGLAAPTGSGNAGGFTTDGNPNLQQALALLEQDPEGSQLLDIARQNGYNIRVGVPPQDGGPGVTVNGLTTFGPGVRDVVINPNASDFMKTLAHELLHAATEDNGNSVQEEINANIVGDRISARINGRAPRNPNEIAAETRPLYEDELPEFN